MKIEVTSQERAVLNRWRRIPPKAQVPISALLSIIGDLADVAARAEPNAWMTTNEVMEYTGYSRSGIKNAVKSGALKCHAQEGLKRSVRFRRDEVERWLEGKARK